MSSLMARLKAQQAQSQAASSSSGGPGGRGSAATSRNNVRNDSKKSASKPSSSLSMSSSSAPSSKYFLEVKAAPKKQNDDDDIMLSTVGSTTAVSVSPPPADNAIVSVAVETTAEAGQQKAKVKDTNNSNISEPEPVKISILEQLVQTSNTNNTSNSMQVMSFHPYPTLPPYSMCSQDEALDRQHHYELSPFECLPSSLNYTSSRRIDINANSMGMNIHTTAAAATPAIKKVRPLENTRSPYPKSTINSNNNIVYSSSSFKTPTKNSSLSNNVPFTPSTQPMSNNPYTPSTQTTTTTTTQLRAARPNKPTHHPSYVIKKYRRSAAGGGTLSERSEKDVRNLLQLHQTVEYLLLGLVIWQMPPPVVVVGGSSRGVASPYRSRSIYSSSGYSSDVSSTSAWGAGGVGDDDDVNDDDGVNGDSSSESQHVPFSLCDTVSFIDDRLRAVQKDLVTLTGTSDDDNLEEGDVQMKMSGEHNGIHATNQSSEININNDPDKVNNYNTVKARSTLRQMQARMVRYSILSSYLLSEVPPSKYEVKFGARALRTSLTCYLNLSLTLEEEYKTSNINNNTDSSTNTKMNKLIDEENNNDEIRRILYEKELRTKDEMMAYMALLHSSAVLRSEEAALPPPTLGEVTSALMEESGSGWGALLSTFCKHVSSSSSSTAATRRNFCSESQSELVVNQYPRWKWALQLASMAQEGNYQRYFQLLERGPNVGNSINAEDSSFMSDHARFLILARCCASHSLNLIRLSALRRFNHAFGKGENVSGLDLARLLRFMDTSINDGDDDYDTEKEAAERAISFCRDAGLPIVDKEVTTDDGETKKMSHVVMKSAPISISGDESIGRMCNPGRINDFFVFGSRLLTSTKSHPDVDALMDRFEQCDVNESVDDWEDRDGDVDDGMDAEALASEAKTSERTVDSLARIDEDDVLIPSPRVLWNLIN